MSETRTPAPRGTRPRAAGRAAAGGWSAPSCVLVLLVVLLVLPLYIDEFWLAPASRCAARSSAPSGLNLLVGTTGQLSLAHAFFLAVGATTYTFVSGSPGGFAREARRPRAGRRWSAWSRASSLAGVAGLLFSPVAARLRGIYLGVASLGLVFIGQHLLNTWTSVTGGFNGRTTPPFSLFGFSFGDNDPYLAVLGVPFGEAERLWYLGLVLALVASCSPATWCAAARAGRCRRCATARSRRR